MKPVFALFLSLAILTLHGCKEDELSTEKYSGVWNYTTNQNCSNVMAVEAITDTEVKLTWSTCIQGTCIATINGNQITIPYQQIGQTNHSATGTITENSMQFNSYRFGNYLGDWIMKVSASK